MSEPISESEQERIYRILEMFHEHDTSFCGDLAEVKGNKFVLRPECKLLQDTYELIASGKTADKWWRKKFKGNYQKWDAWRAKRGIIKGENK